MEIQDFTSAVVLLSGGQDSTTCLWWTLYRIQEIVTQGPPEAHAVVTPRVRCLSIHYGQRHSVEIEAAEKVVAIAREQFPHIEIEHVHVNVGSVFGGDSPLVSDNEVGQYDTADDLPGGTEPTFVVGRNLLFLTIAANHAAQVDASCIVTGVCEEDYGGYPDCRRRFIDAAEVAIAQAVKGRSEWVEIATPLMHLNKRESVELAVSLDGCMEALAWTHTCYRGEVPPCGKCHACHLRARGFREAGVPDPLLERVG